MDPLQYTSLCFILIVYKAFMNNHIFMSVLWSILTMTSFLYHGNRDNKLYYWSDQILIRLMVLLGCLYTFRTKPIIIIFVLLFFAIIVIIYTFELKLSDNNIKHSDSYLTDSLTYYLIDSDRYPDKATQLHMIIHFITTMIFIIIFHYADTINIR